MEPTSNGVESEGRDAVVRMSSCSNTSSPVHCSPDRQHTTSTTRLTIQPASPVFSTSLVAESSSNADHRRRSPAPVRHSPVPAENRPQSALFSPPTDMDTDVSAIIDQAADHSELWRSDISFEVGAQYAVRAPRPK